MILELWNHTFVVDPSWFWNDWMKTVADAILSYYILYHYFKFQKSIKTLCDRQTKQKT